MTAILAPLGHRVSPVQLAPLAHKAIQAPPAQRDPRDTRASRVLPAGKAMMAVEEPRGRKVMLDI